MLERILNLGCGKETYGTHFIDTYPQRKGVVKCNIDSQKIPFPNNFFDIVYSRNVFEHLRNPGFALAEMTRVLKPKGQLILITDNAGFIFSHLHVLPEKLVSHSHYDNKERIGAEDRHYSMFTPLHLQNHLAKVGLKPRKMEYRWSMIESNHPFGFKFARALNGMPWLARLLLPYVYVEAMKTKFETTGFSVVKTRYLINKRSELSIPYLLFIRLLALLNQRFYPNIMIEGIKK